MAQGGYTVDEVWDVRAGDQADLIELIIATMGVNGGYAATQVSPGTVQFTRVYRPMWATVCGVIGLLLCAIGVVLFFVKTSETFTVTVTGDGPNHSVSLTGKVLPHDHGRLLAALQVDDGTHGSTPSPVEGAPGHLPPPPPAPVADAPHPIAPGVVLPPPPRRRSEPNAPTTGAAAPSPAESSGPPPAVSGTGDPITSPQSAAHLGGPSEETVVRPRPSVASSAPGVVLDDGTRLHLAGRTVIGRDPVAPTGSVAIAITDPSMTVSKSHLALTVEGSTIWVEDLHSTNGSGIITAGAEEALAPGAPTPVPAGASVRFGDRTFEVVRG